MVNVVSFEKINNQEAVVIIEGPNIEAVSGPRGRKFASENHNDSHFASAGVESYGGHFPIDLKKKKEGFPDSALTPVTPDELREISKRPKDIAYRHAFRLRRGI